MDDPEILNVLRSIDRRLALQTGPQERDLRRMLLEQILTTPNRGAMWDAIDGVKGSPELAKLADVSERLVQMFVKELLDEGLVAVMPSARGTVVAKNQDAVVQWYLRNVAGS